MQVHVSRSLAVVLVVLAVLAMLATTQTPQAQAAPFLGITGTPAPPTPTNTPVTPTATPVTPTATPVTPTTAPGTPTTAPGTPTPPLATLTPPLPTSTPRPNNDSGRANPVISKQADSDEASIGDEISFTIVVTNRGDDAAEDVVVTDNLATYFDLVDVSTTRGQVSVSGRTITVVLGSLPEGDQVVIRVRVRLTEGAPERLTNRASLTTSSSTNIEDDDVASATIQRVASSGTPTTTATAATPGVPTATGGTPAAPTTTVAPGAPTATPVRPRRLPSTGETTDSLVYVLLGAALLAITVSVLLRWSARRTQEH